MPRLTVELYDARDNVVERRESLSAADAIAFVSEFIVLHGTDPDGAAEGRSLADEGSVRFWPEED